MTMDEIRIGLADEATPGLVQAWMDGFGMTAGQAAHVLAQPERAMRRARSIDRWAAGHRDVPEMTRRLMWTIARDPDLLDLLRDKFTPDESGRAQSVQRLLWAMDRDPTLRAALVTAFGDAPAR